MSDSLGLEREVVNFLQAVQVMNVEVTRWRQIGGRPAARETGQAKKRKSGKELNEDTKVGLRGHKGNLSSGLIFDEIANWVEQWSARSFITLYFNFYRVPGSPRFVRGRFRLVLAASLSWRSYSASSSSV